LSYFVLLFFILASILHNPPDLSFPEVSGGIVISSYYILFLGHLIKQF